MTEQQRQADWAAVHRPETTTEELTRIAQDHPEFMPAVMAHEHAPGATSHAVSMEAPGAANTPLTDAAAQLHPQPTTQAQAAQGYPHPQAQAQAQAQAQQAYAHPMAAHPASHTGDPTNKLAYAALIVAAAGSIASFIDPFIIRGLLMADAHAVIGLVTGAISWFFIIATAILAILALKKKDQPRGRWAAYAALGAAGSGALAFFSSMVGNFFVNFLPYY